MAYRETSLTNLHGGDSPLQATVEHRSVGQVFFSESDGEYVELRLGERLDGVTVGECIGEHGPGGVRVTLTCASDAYVERLGSGLRVTLSALGREQSEMLAESLLVAARILRRRLAEKRRAARADGPRGEEDIMLAESARPLYDRIIIKRLVGKDRTEAGLYIPENAKEKLNEGTVLAVGPGRVLKDGRYLAPCLKQGDHVLFGKYTTPEVRLKGQDVLILREEEILAVVER
jgi:chaperonin GroES